MGGRRARSRSSRPGRSRRRPSPRRASCVQHARLTSFGAAAPGISTPPITGRPRHRLTRSHAWVEYRVSMRLPNTGRAGAGGQGGPSPSRGAQADGHLQRVGADHAGAQDHEPGRWHARHAAQQQAAPPLDFSRWLAAAWMAMRPATSLIGASSGRPPPGAGDGLVGDAHARAISASACCPVRRQMQVGEQDLVRAQQRALAGCGSLTLTIISAACEDLGRIVQQRRAGLLVVAVVQQADGRAGAALDQHAVAVQRPARARWPASGRRGTRGS
jgi:hypothetical protein